MANVIKLYRNGITAGKSGMNKNPTKRGKTQGWTSSTSRRMTKFLYSISTTDLTGKGFSFTLTVRDCPDTPKDWQMLREAYIARLKRRGMIRIHWLTEWQRRGVPHLHGCVYFPDDSLITTLDIKQQWVQCSAKYFSNIGGQDSKPIHEALGWYKYLSKHAVRGTQHYQRNSANIPENWKTNTGRMWGRWGEWHADNPISLSVDSKTYYKFRRLVRGWRRAKAREAFNQSNLLSDPLAFLMALRNITKARNLLKSNNRCLSEIRGVNEFIPVDLGADFVTIAKAHDEGCVEDNDSSIHTIDKKTSKQETAYHNRK